MHPRVWEASGHVEGFTDPLVDCKKCKERFRADHSPARSARSSRASARRVRAVRAHRGAPVQPDVQDLHGPGRGHRQRRLPAARDRAGHLRQLQERADHVAPEAPVRHRADRQVVPQRDHARELPLPHPRVRADGDGVLRQAGRGRAVVRVLEEERLDWYVDATASGASACACAQHGADELAHYAKGCADVEYQFPFGWSELEGIANRTDFDLRRHAEFSGKDLRYFDEESARALRPVRDRAGGRRRPRHARVPGRRLRRGRRRRRGAHRAAPRIPRSRRSRPRSSRCCARTASRRRRTRSAICCAQHFAVALRPGRLDRPALSPPGRGRHAVRHHRRSSDDAGRHRHAARPRLDAADPSADRSPGGAS